MRTKIFFALTVVICVTTSCKKYPDDEAFMHLSTPDKRLTRYLWDTDGITNYITNVQLTSNGGNISFSSPGFDGNASPYFYYDGTYELTDKKKKLKITNGTTQEVKEYTIQRLDKKVLILRDDSLEYSFKAHLIK